jgi:hypothetical protein
MNNQSNARIINEKALEENNEDYVDQYMYQQKNNDDHE